METAAAHGMQKKAASIQGYMQRILKAERLSNACRKKVLDLTRASAGWYEKVGHAED